MVEKEQFPRDKVCGDGQVQGIHPLLKSMGVYDEIEKYGYKCSGTLFSDDREIQYTYNYPDGEFAFATPRYIFDDIINKAALKQGVDYLENFEATEVITRRGQAIGVRGIYDGKVVELEADLVVLANGSHSMLARQMGFYEEDPNYVFYGLRGYYENVRGLSDVIEFHYPNKLFMPLEAIMAYWLPILITAILGFIITVPPILFLDKHLLQEDWVEKSMGPLGMMTGDFITGMMLTRMVDPDFKSNAIADFSIAYSINTFYCVAMLAVVYPYVVTKGAMSAWNRCGRIDFSFRTVAGGSGNA